MFLSAKARVIQITSEGRALNPEHFCGFCATTSAYLQHSLSMNVARPYIVRLGHPAPQHMAYQ